MEGSEHFNSLELEDQGQLAMLEWLDEKIFLSHKRASASAGFKFIGFPFEVFRHYRLGLPFSHAVLNSLLISMLLGW